MAIPAIATPPNRDGNFLRQLIIPVDTATAGDWIKRITNKIKTFGFGILVRKEKASRSDPYDVFNFVVDVHEIPIVNRGDLGSQVEADVAVELIVRALQRFKPFQWTGGIESIDTSNKNGKHNLNYQVSFKVRAYNIRG